MISLGPLRFVGGEDVRAWSLLQQQEFFVSWYSVCALVGVAFGSSQLFLVGAGWRQLFHALGVGGFERKALACGMIILPERFGSFSRV